MLLNQLLQQPKTSSKLLVYDPFREPDREDLVKEVIGLANADVDGPRYILFGINPGSMEGSGVVGLAENAMADLKKAHRLVSALVEPILHLAFIYDRINGKLVGALEIDGCDAGPYVVGHDFSDTLSRGQCWIRDGRELRDADRTDLAKNIAPDETQEPAKPAEPIFVSVGFNGQPDCKVLELAVPDTSNPPFARDKKNIKQQRQEPRNLKSVIKSTIETVTTQILRLRPDYNPDPAADTDQFRETNTLFADADNHYFFEEKALQLNLAVCNTGEESVENVCIELGFPRLDDFDVADHLYTSPFDKRTPFELSQLGYPEVERRDDAILVHSEIETLLPGISQSAFGCALRMAVGPSMQGRKVAINYTLRGQNKQKIDTGRLKILFGEIAA
jgi:hypothetical protein